MSAKNPNPSRHERSDLPPLPFLLVAGGLALVIGGALFGLRYLTVGFESVRASLAPPPHELRCECAGQAPHPRRGRSQRGGAINSRALR